MKKTRTMKMDTHIYYFKKFDYSEEDNLLLVFKKSFNSSLLQLKEERSSVSSRGSMTSSSSRLSFSISFFPAFKHLTHTVKFFTKQENHNLCIVQRSAEVRCLFTVTKWKISAIMKNGLW